jgi:PAS domain S-box-containing protein
VSAATADGFRLLADSAPVMTWVADPKGQAVYFNRPWLEFTGRPLEAQTGLGWTQDVHGEDRERALQAYLGAIDRREPLDLEFRMRRHDGVHRWVLAKCIPVMRDEGMHGYVGSCIDVTERRTADTVARDHFLSILSHDLRTPLNGIKTWAHFLDNQLQDADDPIRRAVAGIMIGVDQQVRLIDDLLDLTRAMAGNLSLVRHPMALEPLVASVVDELRPAAGEQGISIVTRYRLGEAQVQGDSARLRQVFRNLLENAVKFTPPQGRIEVETGVEDAMARVEVRDNGAGIPADFLPHVFDPFRQADQRASRRVQHGVGLGLALVQRLALLHDGHVSCESAGIDRGSTFRVCLPLRGKAGTRAPSASAQRTPGGLPSLEGTRVLLIDDQRETRESLAALLGQAGATVRTAASAREALEVLQASGPPDSPEVVLCDIAMPDEDGYAALRRIRAWEAVQQPGVRRPAVAISAFDEHDDRLRALSEGFQTHLAKPISPDELMRVISNAARAARP